jgi:membrane fusion protein (multidrug efflux system)
VLPGQALHRGDVVATLVSDPAAQTAYAQAASALAFAQRELRRNQDLLALQLATQSQVDSASRQMQDAQSVLDAQRKLGGAQGTAQLLAPFDGVVIATVAAQGERVQAGAAVVQLGRNDTLRVQLEIEPTLSAQLHRGMPVTISVAQDKALRVTSTIAEVQHLVDPKTQMVGAVVLLPAGRQAGLLSGMRVQAAIELGERQAWSVPRQAVLTDDQGAYLYQIAKDKARRVNVSKLLENGTALGVDGKLDASLPVVVLGNYELQDGMSVRGDAR